jgi:ACS family hexuronate transporter-like MFS transporter
MTKWRLATMVTAAIGISYLDRQSLPVAVAAIQRDIPLSNTEFGALSSCFLLAYAVMYAGGGALVDRLGTKRGFLLIMTFWSVACASQSLAMGFGMLAISRFLLGAGEGGGFPAATKVIAEWFPVSERSTAMGLVNAGTAMDRVHSVGEQLARGVRRVRSRRTPVVPVVGSRGARAAGRTGRRVDGLTR